jgi:hypothetical protein
MRHSRQDGEPGRALGGAYLWPRQWTTFGFWLGCLITLFLVGVGLAGVALGHVYAGGVSLFSGVVCLLTGARGLSHREHGVQPRRTSHG